jgi:uncharacterized integral membrane protein
MNTPYKRRRPSLVRNFWVYRRLVGLAIVLGLMLWFIWDNNNKVEVHFPFNLWTLRTTTGLLSLLSALVGSVVTALAMAVFFALRQVQASNERHPDQVDSPLPDDRPPAGYASKASEASPH